MSNKIVLRVKNLNTIFPTLGGVVKAVNGVSFSVKAGKTLGIVGESGCGKSVTALSLLGLVEPPGRITAGEILLNGCNLLALNQKQLRRVRGAEIALVAQDPMTSLNPVFSAGRQVSEAILSHLPVSRDEACRRTLALFELVGLPHPEKIYSRYPFQLSGGQRQRVMIAMALALKPKVLITDEPTTALDVTVQAQILDELNGLKREFNTGIILITHDLGVIAGMADEVAVMYAGSIVEYATVHEIFAHPCHPYTAALLQSIPRLGENTVLKPVPGQPPGLLELPDNCAFARRCPVSEKLCTREKPVLEPVNAGHLVACHYAALKHTEGAVVM